MEKEQSNTDHFKKFIVDIYRETIDLFKSRDKGIIESIGDFGKGLMLAGAGLMMLTLGAILFGAFALVFMSL